MQIHIKVCLETDWYNCQDFEWKQVVVSVRPIVPGDENKYPNLEVNTPVVLIDKLSDSVTISDGKF